MRLNIRQGTDKVEPIPGYGDLETLGYGKDNVVMRRAAASAPLRPMPLSVLAHGRPFDLPAETEGSSSDSLESILRAANEQLAALVPNARFFVAKDSGHDIHQDQPELVTEAIRQVIAAVHSPNAWYDLTSCCVKYRSLGSRNSRSGWSGKCHFQTPRINAEKRVESHVAAADTSLISCDDRALLCDYAAPCRDMPGSNPKCVLLHISPDTARKAGMC